nr:PREDICTED: MAP3K7 C-terminal-like protein [Struthio camelus australis]
MAVQRLVPAQGRMKRDIAMLKDHPKVRGLAVGSWLPFHQPKSITVQMEIPSLSLGTCLSNSGMVQSRYKIML